MTGALVEWYWHGKTKVLGEKPVHVTQVLHNTQPLLAQYLQQCQIGYWLMQVMMQRGGFKHVYLMMHCFHSKAEFIHAGSLHFQDLKLLHLHKEVLKFYVTTAMQCLFNNDFHPICNCYLFLSLPGSITNLHYDKCHAFYDTWFIESAKISSSFFLF
jgi:hypothetical protein